MVPSYHFRRLETNLSADYIGVIDFLGLGNLAFPVSFQLRNVEFGCAPHSHSDGGTCLTYILDLCSLSALTLRSLLAHVGVSM
jgi:hypothetical protein